MMWRSCWLVQSSFRFRNFQTLSYLNNITRPRVYVHNELSYAHGLSNKPFVIETVDQLMKKRELEDGNVLAIASCHEGIEKTFKEYEDEGNRLASSLYHQFGLRPNDVVGLWSSNNYNWALAKLATEKIGAILCTINPFYKGLELEYVVRKARCKLLFVPGCDSKQASLNNHQQIINDEQLLNQWEKNSVLEYIICLDGKVNKDKIGKYPVFHVNDLIESGSDKSFVALKDPENPAYILFTSGTTGKPKGALLSQFSLINNSNFARERFFTSSNEICCCPLPFFHIFALNHVLTGSIVYGFSVILPGYHFNAKAAVDSISKYNISTFFGTPTMVSDLIHYCEQNSLKLDTLKTVGTGGAICSSDLILKTEKILDRAKVLIGYGTTEMSSCVTLIDQRDDINHRSNYVGSPLDYVEIKIVDPNGDMVKLGEPGEIYIKTYGHMFEYYQDEEKTKEAFKNNWYKTGDIGIMSKDGYTSIVGRIQEMIIRGGENIYPREVENILRSHPSIREAQVIGIPNERLGEEVCAYIQLKEKNINEKDVKEYLKDKLTFFKIPKYVHFVDTYPMTSTGKISKIKLKEQATQKI